ncbi:MAG: hypothetical protein ABEJ81_03505 [Haloferacaceae archaeon]
MSERPRPQTPPTPSDLSSGTRAIDTPDGNGDRAETPDLTDYTGEEATLVAFVPAESIESARFLSWVTLNDGIDVVLVTDARRGAAGRDAVLPRVNVPVLVDLDGVAAREYGVDFDDMSEGTIVLIDSTDRIRQTWSTDVDPLDVYATVKRQLELDHPTDGADTR